MSKWETIKGSAGFFATMAVFLLAVGLSGYFLLLDKEEEPLPAIVEEPVETTVSAAVEEVPEPVVEVLTPEPVQETPPPMPEIEVDDTPVIAEAPKLIVTPVHGEVLMAFSMEELTYNPTMEDWRTHNGIDIAAEAGTAVGAAADGEVYTVYDDETMGMTVVIRHEGGYTTSYASLAEDVAVDPGDKVTAGQTIGYVGATALLESAIGDHVHFSVSCDGELVDPNTFLG